LVFSNNPRSAPGGAAIGKVGIARAKIDLIDVQTKTVSRNLRQCRPGALAHIVRADLHDAAAVAAQHRPGSKRDAREAASSSSLGAWPAVGMNSVASRSPVPGLVQQERLDVTGCLYGLAGHRQNIEPHSAVHTGDADRRKQCRYRCWDQRDQKRRPGRPR
jgi:hypothetical protein